MNLTAAQTKSLGLTAAQVKALGLFTEPGCFAHRTLISDRVRDGLYSKGLLKVSTSGAHYSLTEKAESLLFPTA